MNSLLTRNCIRAQLWREHGNRLLELMMVAGGGGGSNQVRHYRFGRQVTQGGYYITPAWFDHLLPESKTKLDRLERAAGFNRKVNALFEQEVKRQQELVARVEKIEVELEKPFPKGTENTLLLMNANISTPFDCAAHISQLLTQRSALALIDSNQYADMHRPLTSSCRLRLLHYKSEDTMPVNYAFWRTCSTLLGSIIKKSFKDEYNVQLVSMPVSNLEGGSFFCDVEISNLEDWQPKPEELNAMTSLLWQEVQKGYNIEPLSVNVELAQQMFADNRYRLAYIQSKASSDPLNVYRLGDHLELCDEPLIGSVAQINNIFVTSVHRVPPVADGRPSLYRFQGIALPKQIHLNSYSFSLIKERSKQLNPLNIKQ